MRIGDYGCEEQQRTAALECAEALRRQTRGVDGSQHSIAAIYLPLCDGCQTGVAGELSVYGVVPLGGAKGAKVLLCSWLLAGRRMPLTLGKDF